MKQLSLALAGCVCIALFCSCENDADSPELSEGEKALKEIAEVLESRPGMSDFAGLLEKVEMEDVQEGEFTVFAVRNSVAGKSVEGLDSVSIRKHIARGRHAKSDMYDGMKLESLGGDLLDVSLNGDEVSVDGVLLDGEEIFVGNSCVHVVSEVLGGQTIPSEPNPDEIGFLWKQEISSYLSEQVILEARLVTGYSGFSYRDIFSVSDKYWEQAYSVLDKGYEYAALLSDNPENESVRNEILTETSLVRSSLASEYGKLVAGNGEMPMEQFLTDLQFLTETLPEQYGYALLMMTAKTYMSMGRWQEAADCAKRVIESGRYELSADPWQTSEKEIILGHYDDRSGLTGADLNPLLYREALLMYAISVYKAGRGDMESLDALNMLAACFRLEPFGMFDDAAVMELARLALQGTGRLYPYFRLLGRPTEVDGFTSPANHLLPVPLKAVEEYGLAQNPGY